MIAFELLTFLHYVSLMAAAGVLALLDWHYLRPGGGGG